MMSRVEVKESMWLVLWRLCGDLWCMYSDVHRLKALCPQHGGKATCLSQCGELSNTWDSLWHSHTFRDAKNKDLIKSLVWEQQAQSLFPGFMIVWFLCVLDMCVQWCAVLAERPFPGRSWSLV